MGNSFYWTAQILIMEAGCLSEVLVAICQPKRPRILKDLDLQTSGFEILVVVFIFKCSAMLYRSLLWNISWSLTVRPIGGSETSVRNYHYTLQISVTIVTEEGRISLFHTSRNCDAQYGRFYSQTSVHERLGSWTIRFTKKISEHKASRMTYCVSSYEHASRQHREAISWEYQRRQYS